MLLKWNKIKENGKEMYGGEKDDNRAKKGHRKKKKVYKNTRKIKAGQMNMGPE
jgi:hypothetical protein